MRLLRRSAHPLSLSGGALSRGVLFFDADLAVFAVTGAQKALQYGINPVMAAVLGMVSGIRGGIARDVLTGEVPNLMRADLFALAALAAAGIISLGQVLGAGPFYPILLGGAACIFLRRMAIYRGWRIPVAHWDSAGSE